MKKSGPALRQELGDVSYLETHPEVCTLFQEVGATNIVKKYRVFIIKWLKIFPYHLMVQKQS